MRGDPGDAPGHTPPCTTTKKSPCPSRSKGSSLSSPSIWRSWLPTIVFSSMKFPRVLPSCSCSQELKGFIHRLHLMAIVTAGPSHIPTPSCVQVEPTFPRFKQPPSLQFILVKLRLRLFLTGNKPLHYVQRMCPFNQEFWGEKSTSAAALQHV